ncbi:hypothetical protein JB92DRAFT_3092311 [Gautieria morchelliformis]|nr:hypothetical protein JB92DRAFT_3092311 [Gautieria morchelliformis]
MEILGSLKKLCVSAAARKPLPFPLARIHPSTLHNLFNVYFKFEQQGFTLLFFSTCIYDTDSVFTASATLTQDMANMITEGDRLRQLHSIHSVGDATIGRQTSYYPTSSPIWSTTVIIGLSFAPKNDGVIPGTTQWFQNEEKPKRESCPYTLPKDRKPHSPMPGSIVKLSSEPATSGTNDIVTRRGAQADSRGLVWSVSAGMDGLPVPRGQAGQGDEGREEGSGRRTQRKKMQFHYYSFDEDGNAHRLDFAARLSTSRSLQVLLFQCVVHQDSYIPARRRDADANMVYRCSPSVWHSPRHVLHPIIIAGAPKKDRILTGTTQRRHQNSEVGTRSIRATREGSPIRITHGGLYARCGCARTPHFEREDDFDSCARHRTPWPQNIATPPDVARHPRTKRSHKRKRQ